MGSNYYSFLNCTVYKARTSRNNFRPPPLRSSSTHLRSFSILRRVSTAGILFLHAIAHAGNRGGIHPFAGFKTIRRRFVGSDWFYPILFAKAASTSTRSTSPLTSIISYGFFSLSLSDSGFFACYQGQGNDDRHRSIAKCLRRIVRITQARDTVLFFSLQLFRIEKYLVIFSKRNFSSDLRFE